MLCAMKSNESGFHTVQDIAYIDDYIGIGHLVTKLTKKHQTYIVLWVNVTEKIVTNYPGNHLCLIIPSNLTP